MNVEELEILERFDRVWERVQSGGCAEEAPNADGERQLMDTLWLLYRGAVCLSKQTSGQMKRELLSLAGQVQPVFCRLQVRWFLVTGDIYMPTEAYDFASSPLLNLRNMWQNARRVTENLQNKKLEHPIFEKEALQDAMGAMEESVRRMERIMLRLFC